MTVSRSALPAVALVGASPASAHLGEDDARPNTRAPGDDLPDVSVDVGVAWIRVDADRRDSSPGSAGFDGTASDRGVPRAGRRGLSVRTTRARAPGSVETVPRARTDGRGGDEEPAPSTERRRGARKGRRP